MERQPASKRRKTEDGYQGEITEEDEWDDDDFDLQLTQAELEHMDTIASQAITQPTGISNQAMQVKMQPVVRADPDQSQSSSGHRKSANPISLSSGSHGSFVKPQNLSRSNSSSSSRNTSSSSSLRNTSNSMSSYSSSSSYPVTPKSASSHPSSSSLKSESSLEMSVGQMARRPSTSGATQSDSQNQEVGTGSVRGNVDRHRMDNTDISVQLQEIKKELSNKDGEIKILRDTLQKKEGEITQAKKERMQTIEQQRREQSEREKNLQVSLDRQTTQLQFKERDIAELHERCRSLESRQQQNEGSNIGGSPRKVVVLQHSPTPNKDRSPVGNVNFPTKRSFMADDRSPKGKSRLSTVHKEDKEKGTRDIGTCTVGDPPTVTTSAIPTSVTRCLRRRLFLSTADHSRGLLTGSQLVSSLLETFPCGGGVDQGIVGLLHPHTGSCDLQRLHFDRDSSNSMLSPLPNRLRPSDSKTSPKQLISVGSSEHRTLALQGIQTLLHNKQCEDIFSDRVNSTRRVLPFTTGVLISLVQTNAAPNKSVTKAPDQADSSDDRRPSDQEIPIDQGAVLLLPLLADYLGHYLDLLSCAVEASPPSPSSSRGGSSSLDSSVESLSSSLSLLLRDSALFANNLEALALAALSILHKLVSYCPSVRAILLESPESLTHESAKDTATAQVTDQDGSGDKSNTHEPCVSSSGSCSNSQGSDIHKYVEDVYILRKIFSLANPGQEAHRYSVHVVERALDILTVLATHLVEDQVPQLLPVLHNSVLANCLDCENDRSVVVRGLTLLTALVKFNSFVSSLYVGPDGCLLCLLYNVCSGPMDKVSTEYCLQASSQFFHCLNNIISVHKGGAVLLLKSDCRCSVQVIRTVVVVLRRLLVLYEEGEKEGCEGQDNVLVLLRQGLLLLHSLYQRDEHFVDHHYLVEHQYVRLIIGLTNVFKHLTANHSPELSALGELWDFDEDYNELSQESEGDEDDIQQMDIS
ncbi:ATR-interacting protein-like [Mizuhopecten yessoensis]|uniref:ATR-interacting protein n=1 Tax=Mizuhopecten yessoensis TaxID=6573 RepID=A0A210QSC5_MIZYE|nr:ATR-interacting protein-like [Mizuhopecten yessoensis]OWF51643.1 ATR-interacting protein [Mizuhopecten yessoensis]